MDFRKLTCLQRKIERKHIQIPGGTDLLAGMKFNFTM